MSKAEKSIGNSPDVRIEAARHTVSVGTEGLEKLNAALSGPFGQDFAKTIDILENASGRIITCGVGKSGHIARKIAATFASTGTAAHYVHPTEASHGDLGMIGKNDVLLILSNSGETVELKDLISYSRRFSVPMIAITGKPASTLGRAADITLELPLHEEACPNGLAPTTSTTLQLVLGDALAIALLENKGFTAVDFKALHPGGKLGASLKFARDLMHSGDELPTVDTGTRMSDALVTMTSKRFGILAVIDQYGDLAGVVTDGDLRRNMNANLLESSAGDIMSTNPVTIGPDTLASSALEILNSRKITSLFVLESGKPTGIIHIHDLLRAGVQ